MEAEFDRALREGIGEEGTVALVGLVGPDAASDDTTASRSAPNLFPLGRLSLEVNAHSL